MERKCTYLSNCFPTAVFIRRRERKQRKQINVVIGVFTVKLRVSIYNRFFSSEKGLEE